MRERFDFSSISRIILENIKKDEYNKEYFYTLFSYAFSLDGIKITDESNISRIIHGIRSVPKEIKQLYQSSANFNYLKEDVSAVLEEVSDIPKLKQQIHELIMQDMTLSAELKEEISGYMEDDLLFITKCIFESFSRKFMKRHKDRNDYVPKKKLDISDFLLDYYYPKSNKAFFGRDRELNAIHEQLGKEHYLFLYGIGGIGKTELALHYGKNFERDYSNVLYLRYSENLYQTICNLDFIDDMPDMCEKQLFTKHYRFFKLLDANTLVILDNFNMLPEEDELLQDFLSLPFHLLVTTRSNLSEYNSYLVTEIESLEELEKLFYAYAPSANVFPKAVEQIIEKVYRHTLTVEIASKTLNTTGLTPEELLVSLKADRLNLSSPNKVRIQKDAQIKKTTPKEHLARLFQLQNLPKEYQTMLQHIRLMPDSGILKKLFCKWMGTADFNIINDLISYGWIQEDKETTRISIHPFLNEVLEITDHPSFLKCQQFIENVGNEYVVDADDEIFYRDLLNMTKSIFRMIDIDDTFLAFCLLEKILKYLEKYMYQNTMDDILKLYEKIIMTGTETTYQTAVYKFYMGVKSIWGLNGDTGIKYFQDAIALLKPFDKSNAELAITLYEKLVKCYMFPPEKEPLLHCAQSIVELRKLYGSTDSLDYDYDNLILALASKDTNTTGLEEIFKMPELETFTQRIYKENLLNVPKEEFLNDLDKIEPDELPIIKPICQKLKGNLQDMALSQQGDISYMEVMKNIFENIVNYLKTDDSKN